MLLAVYADVKDLIGHSLELSEGALHVHLGLILFLIGTRLIRGEPRFLRALRLGNAPGAGPRATEGLVGEPGCQ